ncbi:Glycerophosphoryl diester phosphodiesterase [Collimonas arenae]|uniref:glycerophosphodiester phosphodiesterase n=1 Tax=Collimonas arenae TaxID=279058 RepID=A0A0A1FBD3_9BURK|nr:Glycerophosphoryl diester phosphodiesterase [Collimonas arenae]
MFSISGCGSGGGELSSNKQILVIGHRGASALRPEHTLASYTKAIEDGADVIEPDLVATKDGFLIARHENEISGTTNVAAIAKFADRKTKKMIDGNALEGWFTEDFTLAEIKELRAKERIPQIRPNNTQYDGQFEVPTLTEIIALAKSMSAKTGRTIHLYPETKHPSYFQSIGLPLEDRLLTVLEQDDYSAKRATIFIQSFETANLKSIRTKIGKSHPNYQLIQLMDDAKVQPPDFVLAGSKRTYGDLMTAAGMWEVAAYADGVGPYKLSIIPQDSKGNLGKPTALVSNAHEAGLRVHPYTFRPENNFLPADLKSNGLPATRNPDGLVTEIQTYLKAGIDGFFTDDPAIGRLAVDSFKRS